MKLLAIDPGTHCGWAAFNTNNNVMLSGVWDLSVKRHEGGGMRFLRLRKYLAEAIDGCKPDAVYFESVMRHLGTDAAHIYGGIVAEIQAACEEHEPKIPYAGIPVGTIKKVATGKGNANKEAMLAAAARRWPDYQCEDDNEADARFCALAAVNQ
jgi:crossover junction endodeoxyribonuclease RuvC